MTMGLEMLLNSLTPRSNISVKKHALVLDGLDSEIVILGLSEAIRTATGWLTPEQLYDICMGGSRADFAQQAAQEAWQWSVKYAERHGSHGHIKHGHRMDAPDGTYTWAPDIPAPPIPELTGRVLTLLGGSIPGGFDKLGLTPTVEIGWLKKEFIAAYVRAGRLG